MIDILISGVQISSKVLPLEAGFRHGSLVSLFSKNRILHSHFRGVHQFMNQPTTFLLLFSVPRLISIVIT